ncbi:MAG: PAS domain-containing protein [Leptolyngbyaceae cyanobacterium bins.349]|nr:PAS domain-containing protein [Leptolyngbyaceae cyanobacterium bins.349]
MISRFWNSFGTQSSQTATVFETLLAPLCIYDFQGEVIYTSQKFLELLQVTPGFHPKSFNLEQFVHPDDRSLDLTLKQRLMDEAIHCYTVEKRFITQAQTTIWVNLTVSRWEGSELPLAHPPYCVALLEDITDQRRLYDALIRTEEKWKTFVLNSPHLFVQVSDGGNMLYISPAVERTLGYHEAELLDRSIVDFIHPHDLNEFKYSFYQWMNHPPSGDADLECRWRTQSGHWADLYVHGQRFPLSLGLEGIAITGCHIRDRPDRSSLAAISHYLRDKANYHLWSPEMWS